MKTLLIYILIPFLWLGSSTEIRAQDADKLFQQGMVLEEGEGNLEGAIDIYSQLVADASVNRNTQANALLHVGICFEKLENPSAKKTYQKLITEYADQDAIVAVGKLRLKDLTKSNPTSKSEGIVATQVWSPAQDTYGVSPDGRYLNYIDWNSISLNIKDLKKGTTRMLSKKGTWKRPMEFPDNSIWSPDGKKLAYYWFVEKDVELHVVNFDGTSDKIILKGKNGTTPWPVTWTLDGNHIVALKGNKSNDDISLETVLVSVKDGSVKTFDIMSDCGCNIDISPDNKNIVYSKQEDIYIESLDGNVTSKIIDNSANNKSPRWSRDGKEILFVSDRYGTNDLWKLKVENGKANGIAEIVKVDLGSRYSLFRTTKDNTVFYRTDNSRIDVYIAQIDGDSEPIKISNLEQKGNVNPTWSPDGKYASFLRWPKHRNNNLGRQFLFTLYDPITKASQDIDTEIYGVPNMSRPQWTPKSNSILIHGIIKDQHLGGIFEFDINAKKNSPVKVESNVFRQTIDNFDRFYKYSSDMKSLYYLSKDLKSILKYDIKSEQEKSIVTGDKEILYYKLSNDNSNIVFGYRREHNKDIYIVSSDGGVKKKILTSDCKCSPNVLSWSKDDKYLFFKNGKFGALKKIMRVNVDGSNPIEIFDLKKAFPEGGVRRVDMNPDGKSVLVELEVGKGAEVWKLEGVFNE